MYYDSFRPGYPLKPGDLDIDSRKI
jgi:hypothetical protein